MGMLDRLGKIVSGFGGAIASPFGLAKDLLVDTWGDDEYEGFFGTLKGASTDRAGQAISNLFGPKEGIGAAIGGLPRKQVREPAKKVFEALEWAYREGVSEPTSTIGFVSNQTSLTGSGGGDITDLFNTGVWKAGYRNAQSMSPGQVAAGDLLRADLSDPEDVKRAKESPLFTPISGSLDTAMRLFASPDVVIGKAAGAARIATLVKPIKPGADLERIMGTKRVQKFNEALEGKDASQIRDQFFPNDVNGAALSSLLADAKDSKVRESVLLLAMGDRKQLLNLRTEQVEIAARMERLTDEQGLLRSLQEDNFATVNLTGKKPATNGIEDVPKGAGDEFEDPAAAGAWLDNELDRTTEEIEALYDTSERLARAEQVFGQVRAQPRARVMDERRVAVTRSHFYQKSTLATPVRMVFDMRPPRFVDLNDPAGDGRVTQWLRQSGYEKTEQDVWRSRYMAVSSPEGRGQIVTQMEDDAIRRLADEKGLSPDDLGKVMSKINQNRATAQQVMKGRVYDGEGRSRLQFKDDATGELHDYPLLASQTANVLPLADIGAARKAITEIGEIKKRFPGADLTEDALEKFTRYWKPSVLLRVGWPIRVVTDEQMRIIGKIGAISVMMNAGRGLANVTNNQIARASAVASRGVDDNGVRISAKEAAKNAEQTRIGFGTEKVGDYEIDSLFGTDPNAPTAAFNLTASKPVFERAFSDVEAQELNELRRRTANYKSISPTADPAEYGDAWLDAVNQQIGRDPLARIFLKGGEHEDAVKWLKTPEGKAHLDRLPLRRRNLEEFAGAVQDQVEAYTMGNADIMAAALRQRATTDDLFKVAPDPAQRPMVHGEVLSDAIGKGPVSEALGRIVQTMYTALGSVPSDTLSRHPYAATMYSREARRMTEMLDAQARKSGERLTAQDLDLIKKRSTEYAISETQKLLYDLAEQSDMAHLLRFVSPFYSAWQETMTRWAGIAVENPGYAMQMKQVWESPERAGIITDEFGNPVGPNDETDDERRLPDGTLATIGRERLITLSIPEYAKDIMGFAGLRTQEKIYFNKKSFNMILQGNPGVGVPVQFPINEIIKDRPDLAASMRFVMPFGPTQTPIRDFLLPATARRIASRSEGEEDRVFRNTALRVYFDKVTDYRLGKRDTEPTWAEAMRDTKGFYNIRAVASFISPAAPGFRSPYQPYIDTYRRLRSQDIQTADSKFLDMFGEEFFALTQSFTRSADGVPPTVEAFTARSKYKDLIEASPELGALIIGEEGAGEYANSVYQHQLAKKVAPGSTTNQRRALSFEEVQGGPNTRLGWLEYRKVSDLIDAERIDRGLPNLQVKGAQDLADLKRALVGKLSEKYPEWFEVYSVVDRNAQAKRLVAMRAIADDPRMSGRQDMQGIRTYFDARGAVRGLLEQRKKAGGSDQLDSSGNQDVSMLWAAITAKIVERNLAFSDTYYRYLERDDLSAA